VADVVILPSGELAAKITELAQAWATLGLISEPVWVVPDEWMGESVESRVSVPARVASRDGNLPVELFDYLAGQMDLQLSVVAVIDEPSTHTDSSQRRLLEHVFQPGGPFRRSLPAGEAMKLAMSRLLVLPPEGAVVSDGYENWAWHHHFVISPENRSTPFSVDGGIQSIETLAGLVLANLSSLVGLWTGVQDGGLLPSVPPDPSSQFRIMRTFARAVSSRGIASSFAAQAQHKVADPEFDPFSPEQGLQIQTLAPVANDRLETFVKWLVEKTLALSGAALSYGQPPVTQDPARAQTGVLHATLEFLQFLWDKLLWLPIWFAKSFAAWLGKTFTKALHGRDGSTVVTANAAWMDGRDLDLKRMADSVNEAIEAAMAAPSATVAPTVVPTPPNLWKSIRGLMFASLDGSSFPSECAAGTSWTVSGKDVRQVLPRAEQLVFDSEATYATPFDTDLPPAWLAIQPNTSLQLRDDYDFENLLDWFDLREHLSRRLDTLNAELDGLGPEVADEGQGNVTANSSNDVDNDEFDAGLDVEESA
jgi:hypothetical protein